MGPQIDTDGSERETVAVVDAGVLAEAVQEDDGCPRFAGGPVPVVSPAGDAPWASIQRKPPAEAGKPRE